MRTVRVRSHVFGLLPTGPCTWLTRLHAGLALLRGQLLCSRALLARLDGLLLSPGPHVLRAAHWAACINHQSPGQVVTDPLPVSRAQDDDEADQASERPCIG